MLHVGQAGPWLGSIPGAAVLSAAATCACSALPLEWSESVANAAFNWISQCNYTHSPQSIRPNIGENIAMGFGTCAEVVAAW